MAGDAGMTHLQPGILPPDHNFEKTLRTANEPLISQTVGVKCVGTPYP
jgi:hypothetical protein